MKWCKLPQQGLGQTHLLAILSLENTSGGNKTVCFCSSVGPLFQRGGGFSSPWLIYEAVCLICSPLVEGPGTMHNKITATVTVISVNIAWLECGVWFLQAWQSYQLKHSMHVLCTFHYMPRRSVAAGVFLTTLLLLFWSVTTSHQDSTTNMWGTNIRYMTTSIEDVASFLLSEVWCWIMKGSRVGGDDWH